MNPIKDTKEMVEESSTLLKNYAEHELDYLKLKVFYQVSAYTSSLTKKVVIGGFLLLFLAFATIALAIYLGELMDSAALGFLVVSIGYLMIAVVFFILRKWIEKKIIASLSKTYFDS